MSTPVLYSEAITMLTTDIEHLDNDWHRHMGHHQLVYTIKGTLRISVEEASYFLSEGHIALIPGNAVHKLKSNNQMVKLFLLYFPSAGGREFRIINTTGFLLENLRFISKQGPLISARAQLPLYEYIIAFLNLPAFTEQGNTPGLKGLIAPRDQRLSRVLAYIRENYIEDLKLSEVASMSGFTERHLSRVFKKENLSFNNYLNYQRITRAIEMFAEHNLAVETVGYAVGYKTPSNFSRTFKKFIGVSPTEFIKANQTRKIE